jgi:uncharacterized protein (TIGR02391 family)
MVSSLDNFEATVRALARLPIEEVASQPAIDASSLHPFDVRNIHPDLPAKVKKLFDDGHFAEATFHAFKYLDKKVQGHSGLSEAGFKLMMAAFDDTNPKVQLTALKTESEKDEQKGYRFVFAGSVQAIRNPRGHEYSVVDSPDVCLDHLSLVSMLLRRLESAGFK